MACIFCKMPYVFSGHKTCIKISRMLQLKNMLRVIAIPARVQANTDTKKLLRLMVCFIWCMAYGQKY